jgi:hypothetical protein
VIQVDDRVADVLIEELVAVERGCCPFFDLDWQPEGRRLAVAVPGAHYEPALEALASALGLTPAPP